MNKITQKEWAETFKEFLECERIWGRFVLNLNIYREVTSEDYLNSMSPRSFVTAAFYMGYDKIINWVEVDARWQKLMNEKEQKLEKTNDTIDNAEKDIIVYGNKISHLLKKYYSAEYSVCVDSKKIEFKKNHNVYNSDKED